MATKQTKKPAKKAVEVDITEQEGKRQAQETVQVVERIIVKEPAEVSTEFSKFTPAQLSLIKRTIATDATDDELSMFIQVCASSKLNPFLRQIHFVKRWDSKLGKEVGAIQVGIDGLRSIADRTEAYVGSNEPIYQGETAHQYTTSKDKGEYKAPDICKVTVKKIVQGIVGEFSGEARWSEFYPGDRQGFQWRRMPHVMLGKCAEAQALRKAFPSQMSGLYVQEELDSMQAVDAERKRVEAQFAQAQSMIQGVTDTAALKDLKEKFKASEKYSDEQKVKLMDVVDVQLQRLANRKTKADDTTTEHETTTVPQL